MPLKKLRDFAPFQPCNHPGHNPPTMIVLSPGVYEHTCPACGKKQQFVVNPLSSLRDRLRSSSTRRSWS